MFSRFRLALVLALLLAFVFTLQVFAGGWAVITLDELPTNVVAGKAHTVGFTVLQHGRTPLDGLNPTVTARLPFNEKIVAYAEPDGKPGHYVATLTFPQEGEWDWSIQAFTMDQSMPVLSVAAPGAALASQPMKSESVAAGIPSLLILRMLVFGMAIAGLVFALRYKSRLIAALTGLCLVIGIGTFIMGAPAVNVEAQSKSGSDALLASSNQQVELGRQLFIAKGCITCHYNERAASRSEYLTIQMGAPDLSNYASSPEILYIRLKDPAAAKSDTKMPDLGLNKTEIEALIAFINSK